MSMTNLGLNTIGAAAAAAPATPFRPSGARQIVGGVVGGALNAVLPGVGSLVGSAISGVPSDVGSSMQSMIAEMQSQSMDLLMLQYRMNQQNQAFETISNIMKSEHDVSMDTIRNIK